MRELRCLVFTEQEVIRAVVDRRRKLKEPIPLGTIHGTSYQEEDGAGVSIALKIVADDGEVQELRIPPVEAAAAMVGYCMDRKIPLPVKSEKFLHIVGDGLTLMITVNFNKPPRMVSEGGEARTLRARRFMSSGRP